jgi:hypothetical protein
MKICWDNLEKLRYSKRTGKWYIRKNTYHYIERCEVCSNPFLSQNKNGTLCSLECSHNSEKNKELGYKLGKSWKGKKKTNEHKENISKTKIRLKQNLGENNPNFGNKWSNYQKQQMSIKKQGHRKGIKRPNQSLRFSGKGNPNWQGGKSFEEYCPVWKDKEYKESILERDGNECLNPLCYKTSEKLCIHHIDYDKKNCVPNNLITTCFSCNVRANFNREFWQKHYEEIMIQRRK